MSGSAFGPTSLAGCDVLGGNIVGDGVSVPVNGTFHLPGFQQAGKVLVVVSELFGGLLRRDVALDFGHLPNLYAMIYGEARNGEVMLSDGFVSTLAGYGAASVYGGNNSVEVARSVGYGVGGSPLGCRKFSAFCVYCLHPFVLSFVDLISAIILAVFNTSRGAA